MSDNLARVRPNFTPSPSTTPAERRLEIVAPAPARRKRPRITYALTATAGVAAIVVAQLLLSVGISQGAYEISTLRGDQVELDRTAESVSQGLVRLTSPQSLASNAESLGMVSNSNPVYLRLSDGAVLGAPSSALGSQGGAASLVPNSLLTETAVLTQIDDASLGTADGGAATVAVIPTAAVPIKSGLPSPATR
jgi:hypothetical protein